MVLSMQQLDEWEKKVYDSLILKANEAKRGHDWVVCTTCISNYDFLQLIALAKVGYPYFMKERK